MRNLVLLFLLAIAASASAQKLSTVVWIADGSNGARIEHTSTGASVDATQTTNAHGHHEGAAYADFGVLRAYAEETAGANPDRPYDYDGMFVTATATFADSLRFETRAPHDDARGYVTFQYRVDGEHASSGLGPSGYYDPDRNYAARSAARATLSQNGNPAQQLYQESRAGALYGDDFLGKTQTVTLGFNWGEAFDLSLSIQAAAMTLTNTSQTGTSDLAHIALWGGIVSVTDYAGNPIAYSLSSASGHDWSKASTEPVPEPASLAALGLGALGLLRRRRK